MRKRGVLDRFVEGSSYFDGARVVIVGKGDDRQHGSGEEHHVPDGCEALPKDHRTRIEGI